MAIFHLSVKVISRGKGKSAVGAAAYRSGERIENEYDSVIHDYTRKRGIIHTQILLPPQAPAEYYNRSVLWNAVEKVEKAKNAQLARDIEISLPRELPFSRQKQLLIGFVSQTFVKEGMCADICFHDKLDGNPHAHIMLTMRPINEDGSWGQKQKKVYALDENGNKIYDKKKRQYKCKTVPTTDWNESYKCEQWRSAWAEYVNNYLRIDGIKERVDHRSYQRQGIEQIPTIHLGPVASQMEKKGRISERGRINRQIKEDNRLLRSIKIKMGELKVAAKKTFDEKVKEFTTLLLRIRSRFITTMYQDISNDVKEAQLKTSLHYNETAIQKCYHIIQQIEKETEYDRMADYREDLFKAFYDAEVYSMKEVKQIVSLLQDRDKAISQLQKQKEVLHKNLDEDSEKRQKLITSMSKDEFYSTIAKESVYKKIEDEKTRKDLKEFYGDEYQDMIFKEAVKSTDSELSLKIPDREHKAIVQKVISRKPEQALNEQEHKYSKDYQPPIKQKSR